jgi:hypothetical protein
MFYKKTDHNNLHKNNVFQKENNQDAHSPDNLTLNNKIEKIIKWDKKTTRVNMSNS